jgi:hypothetical protein
MEAKLIISFVMSIVYNLSRLRLHHLENFFILVCHSLDTKAA